MAWIYKPKKVTRKERWGKDKENHQYYNTTRWQRLRDAYIQEHPLCELCEKEGKVTPTEEVHHIVEISTNPDMAYEWTNLMALCQYHHHLCHNIKRQKKKKNEH